VGPTLVPVWNATPFDGLSPDDRVLMAAIPFVIATLLRLILGPTQLTRWAATISTMWFAINVLLAPYSAGMRQDLIELGSRFR
jgi:nitrate/nitrite transporter NarK